jgi:hypothetical protein
MAGMNRRRRERSEVRAGEPKAASAKGGPPLITETQRLLERIEAEAGHPVLAYWVSNKGEVCQRDAISMLRLLRGSRRHKCIGMFLRTSGGDTEAALRLVNVLRNYADRLTLFLPYVCASSGTLVAMGADEIHMGAGACLTPVDSSLNHPLCPRETCDNGNVVWVSQHQFRRVLRLWRERRGAGNPYPELFKHIHPVVIGELDRSDALSLQIGSDLLGLHMRDSRKAGRICRALCLGYPSHTYPIGLREARRLGLNAKPLAANLESLLSELGEIYGRMTEHVRHYRDENHGHSMYVTSIQERIGMRIHETDEAEMTFRPELRRWDTWGERETRHEARRVGSRWVEELFAVVR